MLQLAHRTGDIAYVMAPAERLPLRARVFDVLTVSSGVHWFNQQRFFAEAARVLNPGGWLVIYDHFFVGSVDRPDFDQWFETSYADRYPPPPRASMADRPPVEATAFREIEAFEYDDTIDFTQGELVSYLLSHSNTIAASVAGTETYEATESWLKAQTSPWYQPPTRRRYLFRGAVRVLRPRPPSYRSNHE